MTSIYPSSTSSSTNSSSTSSKNLLRISGMSSGIDTDAVVKSMVSNYQSKIDKANQGKQTLQWKQEAYRDIIKSVKGLQDYFDPLSSKYVLSGKSLNINTAATDDSSIVSATSGSSAKPGTYNIHVSQLAEQAKVEGTSKNSIITMPDTISASAWQDKVLMFNDGTSDVPIKLSNQISDLNGDKSISTDELVADINKQIAGSSLSGKISASFVNDGTNNNYIKFTKSTSVSNAITLSTDSNKSTIPNISSLTNSTINSGISSSSKLITDLGFSTGAINFTLGSGTASYNVSLTVDSSTTMQNLIDKVNSATSGAVNLNVDDTTGKISFQSKNYGSASSIKLTDTSTSNNIITTFGIAATSTNPITQTGKDAIVAIKAPGQATATTTTQSSNKFTINGVAYNLVGVNETDKTSNITVTANSDTVVSNIKSFIDDYNSVISQINTKLTEKKNNDYAPLTDAQKEGMSADQITAWETKAKVGILRNDDNLSNLMTQLRGMFSSPVYSKYDSNNTSTGKISLNFGQYGSNAIGIDMSTDYDDGGKLVLEDETKLKNAIENNIDDFKKMFIGSSDSTLSTNQSYSGSKKYYEDGLFTRMDTILRDYVGAPGVGKDGTYSYTGTMNIFVNKQYDYSTTGSGGKNTLPDQVYNETLSISKLKTQMSDAETRYYNKFTALETAMNQLNSQQSQLSSMLGTS
ncbi:flagellar filament capping protein FliD [Clostridium beijerinckii]|uniref:Flagellar hook-associated protein 2 n=1 Tax=Clostridium beijerinckii TaxID=1520 RepID=A0A1S9NCF1_CLOBE|nr:flagellar filament capping protein FliD [Clostridium beijerinckii]OOP75161.1 hypothetical protein CBEIBR21_03050 [Clostridium beijerinckii]